MSLVHETRLPRLVREIKSTFLLAWPVVLGQLSSMGMNVINTLLAGRHSALTLAAVAVGSAIWSLVVLTLIGVLMALPPSISQLNGGNRRGEIGPLFRQALWLALLLGMLLLFLLRGSGWLMHAIGIAEAVQPGARDFLHGIGWGAPALGLYFGCRYLSEGLAWTLPTMVFGLAGLLLLAPLGYALMLGVFGLPEWGAAGLGYATAMVLWAQALAFLLYLACSRRFADLGLFSSFDPPRAEPISELLRIGLPMGLSIFMEGSLFVATGLVIGQMGAVAVAAHQIALNTASVAFMIPLGVAMATTVRVGFAVGRGDGSGVRQAAVAGYTLVLATQAVSAAVLLLAGSAISGLYTYDAGVLSLAVALMGYAAAFQFSDGIQVLSAGALRGLKDTRVPMYLTAFAYWGFGMPLGMVLSIGSGWGPQGMWAGLIAGLSVAAIALTGRFWRLAQRLPVLPPLQIGKTGSIASA